MKNPILSFIVNIGSLLLGFCVTFSGLAIQIKYHMGRPELIDFNKKLLGFDYSDWSNIHKIAILFLSVFMLFHIILHWNWFKTIIKKNLIAKNRNVLMLSTIFILVAITGYVSWLIDLKGNHELLRRIILEIHDKITIIFLIFLLLHVVKRLKWYPKTLNRILKN